MIQQVIYPKSKSFTLKLEIPENWIGKKITVLCNEGIDFVKFENKLNSKKSISSIFEDCRIDLKNFKFNRDEANSYE
jgi:hypothetical protein